jgi:signal transduction histidine kinase
MIRLAFGAVIVLFAVTSMVVLGHVRSLQLENRQTMGDALASVELVSRIVDAVDDERLLVDAHIYEKRVVNMQRIEDDLAHERREGADAARAYEPIAKLSGEREMWEVAKSDMAYLEHVIDKVIDLSRENLDDEARAMMSANVDRFDALDRVMTALTEMNRTGADRVMLQTRAAEDALIRFVLAVTVVGVVCASAFAWWVSRVSSRREQLSLRLSMELEARNRALDERNRELDAFAGRVAHDLRGPLTAVGLAGAQLAKHVPERGVGAILERGVQRMETLIDDLLALARVEGAPNAPCETADVGASVRQDLERRVAGVGGVLMVDVEPATVRCAPGLLQQALVNLGENAVKYRRADVPLRVEIRGRVDDGTYVYSVIDNGVGITSNDARHVFEPFFRAERTRVVPGTGLGLSIVRRIVEAHGGSVSVDTELGAGTTFVIRLPLAERCG